MTKYPSLLRIFDMTEEVIERLTVCIVGLYGSTTHRSERMLWVAILSVHITLIFLISTYYQQLLYQYFFLNYQPRRRNSFVFGTRHARNLLSRKRNLVDIPHQSHFDQAGCFGERGLTDRRNVTDGLSRGNIASHEAVACQPDACTSCHMSPDAAAAAAAAFTAFLASLRIFVPNNSFRLNVCGEFVFLSVGLVSILCSVCLIVFLYIITHI